MNPTALKIHRDALLERGWSEAELRGFPGENLLRALDFAWAPA